MQREAIYEDEVTFAFKMDGRILVIPKDHYTILEQVPDIILKRMVKVANHLTKKIFRLEGVTGTNIVINNGVAQKVPHFAIHIVPRKDNDGLLLRWPPKKIEQEKMLKYQNAIKSHIVSKVEKKNSAVGTMREQEVKDNYQIRMLSRNP